MTARVEIILLAAGRSSRMEGGDKTLEPVSGVSLLRHLALECIASKATKTHLVLPPDKPERREAIRDLDLDVIEAKDAHMGMSASLKAGVSAGRDADGLLIVLADMPEIRSDHINALIAAFDPENDVPIIRAATRDGTPGHPVLFAQSLFDALQTLTGDQGARAVLERNKGRILLVKLDGNAATTDLDTPQDWARWRASQQ